MLHWLIPPLKPVILACPERSRGERSEGSQLYWLGLHVYNRYTNLKGEILRFAPGWMTAVLGEDGNPSLRSGDTVVATYGNQSVATTSDLTTPAAAEAGAVTPKQRTQININAILIVLSAIDCWTFIGK